MPTPADRIAAVLAGHPSIAVHLALASTVDDAVIDGGYGIHRPRR